MFFDTKLSEGQIKSSEIRTSEPNKKNMILIETINLSSQKEHQPIGSM
jgi:hypothetical protein